MKESIITFVSFMVIFYLLGAFIAASFDISQWDIQLRAAIVFFGFPVSMLIAATVADSKKW
jgi:small neutral amino acid transporter SnatA (MarC family)